MSIPREALLRTRGKKQPEIPEPPTPEASQPLPCWKILPLDSKFPVTPAPKGDVTFVTTRMCEPAYKSRQRVTFDLTDPHNRTIRTDYNALTDPYLKEWIARPRTQRQIRAQKLVTEQGRIPCNVRDFNDYRKYVRHQAVLAARAEKDDELESAAERRQQKIQETKAKAELMSAEVKYKVMRAQHKAKQEAEDKRLRLEVKQTMLAQRQKEWEIQEVNRKKKKLVEKNVKWHERQMALRRREEEKRQLAVKMKDNIEDEAARNVLRNMEAKEMHAATLEARKRDQWERKREHQERLLESAQRQRHRAEEHIRSLKRSYSVESDIFTACTTDDKPTKSVGDVPRYQKTGGPQVHCGNHGNESDSCPIRRLQPSLEQMEKNLIIPRSRSVKDAGVWVVEEVLRGLGLSREAGRVVDLRAAQRGDILDRALDIVADTFTKVSALSPEQDMLSKIVHMMVRKIKRDQINQEEISDFGLLGERSVVFPDTDVSIKAERMSRIKMSAVPSDILDDESRNCHGDGKDSQDGSCDDDDSGVMSYLRQNVEDVLGVERDMREFLDVLQQEPMKAEELRDVVGSCLRLAAGETLCEDEEITSCDKKKVQCKKKHSSVVNKHSSKKKGVNSKCKAIESGANDHSSSVKPSPSHDKLKDTNYSNQKSSKVTRTSKEHMYKHNDRSRSRSSSSDRSRSADSDNSMRISRKTKRVTKRRGRLTSRSISSSRSNSSCRSNTSRKSNNSSRSNSSSRSNRSRRTNSFCEDKNWHNTQDDNNNLVKRQYTAGENSPKRMNIKLSSSRPQEGRDVSRASSQSSNSLQQPDNTEEDVSDYAVESSNFESDCSTDDSALPSLDGASVKTLSKRMLIKIQNKIRPTGFAFPPVRLHRFIAMSASRLWRATQPSDGCRLEDYIPHEGFEDRLDSLITSIRSRRFPLSLVRKLTRSLASALIKGQEGGFDGVLPSGVVYALLFRFQNDLERDVVTANFILNILENLVEEYNIFKTTDMDFRVDEFCMEVLKYTLTHITGQNSQFEQDLFDIMRFTQSHHRDLWKELMSGNERMIVHKTMAVFQLDLLSLQERKRLFEKISAVGSDLLNLVEENVTVTDVIDKIHHRNNTPDDFKTTCYLKCSLEIIENLRMRVKLCDVTSVSLLPGSVSVSKSETVSLGLCTALSLAIFNDVLRCFEEDVWSSTFLYLFARNLIKELWFKDNEKYNIEDCKEFWWEVKEIVVRAQRYHGENDKIASVLGCALKAKCEELVRTRSKNSSIRLSKENERILETLIKEAIKSYLRGVLQNVCQAFSIRLENENIWEVYADLIQESFKKLGDFESYHCSEEINIFLQCIMNICESEKKRFSSKLEPKRKNEHLKDQHSKDNIVSMLKTICQSGYTPNSNIWLGFGGSEEHVHKRKTNLSTKSQGDAAWENLVKRSTRHEFITSSRRICAHMVRACHVDSVTSLAVTLAVLSRLVSKFHKRLLELHEVFNSGKLPSKGIAHFFISSQVAGTKAELSADAADAEVQDVLSDVIVNVEEVENSINLLSRVMESIARSEYHSGHDVYGVVFSNVSSLTLAKIVRSVLTSLWHSVYCVSTMSAGQEDAQSDQPGSIADTVIRSCLSKLSRTLDGEFDCYGVWSFGLGKACRRMSCSSELVNFVIAQMAKTAQHIQSTNNKCDDDVMGDVDESKNNSTGGVTPNVECLGELVNDVLSKAIFNIFCLNETGQFPPIKIASFLEFNSGVDKVHTKTETILNSASGILTSKPLEAADRMSSREISSWFLSHLSSVLKNVSETLKVQVGAALSVNDQYDAKLRGAACLDTLCDKVKSDMKRHGLVVVSSMNFSGRSRKQDEKTSLCSIIPVREYFAHILSNAGAMVGVLAKERKQFSEAISEACHVNSLNNFGFRSTFYRVHQPIDESNKTKYLMLEVIKIGLDEASKNPKVKKTLKKPTKPTREEYTSSYSKNSSRSRSLSMLRSGKSTLDPYTADILTRQKWIAHLKKYEIHSKRTDPLRDQGGGDHECRQSGDLARRQNEGARRDNTDRRHRKHKACTPEKVKPQTADQTGKKDIGGMTKTKPLKPISKQKNAMSNSTITNESDVCKGNADSDNDTLKDLSKNDTLDEQTKSSQPNISSSFEKVPETDISNRGKSDKAPEVKTNRATRLRRKPRCKQYDFFPPDDYFKTKSTKIQPKESQEQDDVDMHKFKFDCDTNNLDDDQPLLYDDKRVVPVIMKLLERELPLETFVLQKCLSCAERDNMTPANIVDFVATIDHLWTKREPEYRKEFYQQNDCDATDCEATISKESSMEEKSLALLQDLQTGCGGISQRAAGAVHNILRNVESGGLEEADLVSLMQHSEYGQRNTIEVKTNLVQEVSSGLLSMIERVEQGSTVPALFLERSDKLLQAIESTTVELGLHNDRVLHQSCHPEDNAPSSDVWHPTGKTELSALTNEQHGYLTDDGENQHQSYEDPHGNFRGVSDPRESSSASSSSWSSGVSRDHSATSVKSKPWSGERSATKPQQTSGSDSSLFSSGKLTYEETSRDATRVTNDVTTSTSQPEESDIYWKDDVYSH